MLFKESLHMFALVRSFTLGTTPKSLVYKIPVGTYSTKGIEKREQENQLVYSWQWQWACILSHTEC